MRKQDRKEVIQVQLPPLHELQQMVDAHPARFKVLVCGRRWGKTRLAVCQGIKRALNGRRVWWVAPSYQTTGIGWRLAKDLASDIPSVRVRETDKVLFFPGGGEFWFKSSEIYDNLRGEGIGDLFMDEADFQDERAYTEVLRPALSDQKGTGTFISTPYLEGGWFHKLFLRGQDPEFPDWMSWSFPTWTNPYIDQEEIEEARRTLTELTFRREYGAEFVSTSGTRVSKEWFVYSQATRQEMEWVSIGIDPAISIKSSADYTAVVVVGRCRNGFYHVLYADRFREGFRGIIRKVVEIARNWSPNVVYVEEVHFTTAIVEALLTETNYNVRGVKPIKDKISRFGAVESRYQQRLIHHAVDLPREFIDELLAFPVGVHDDFCDALVLAIVGEHVGDMRVEVGANRFDLLGVSEEPGMGGQILPWSA